MSFPGNSFTYKTIFEERYQLAWWKAPVYPVLAYEKFYDKLEKGQTIKWTWSSDPFVSNLNSSTGAYNVYGRKLTDDTLTIDTFPSVSDRYPFPEGALDHRPTMEKWADDQAHAYLWKMDSDVLLAAYQGASSSITGSTIGSSGAVVPTAANVPQIFSAGVNRLMLNDVVKRGYNGQKKYQNDRSKDYGDRMPIAIIPPEVHGFLLLSVGYKNTDLGDETLRSGYLGYMYGFNIFVSNSLPFTINYVVASGNATNGDAFTLWNGVTDVDGNSLAITFTLVSGTPTNAGDIKIGATAADTATNIESALNAPFTDSSTFASFDTLLDGSASAVNAPKANLLTFTSADANSATVSITVIGHGKVPYADTAASDGFDDTTAIVHAILGTSQAVAVAETYAPKSEISAQNFFSTADGGFVAKDILTYGVYGKKVFRYQKRMLIDLQIAASSLSAPIATFN